MNENRTIKQTDKYLKFQVSNVFEQLMTVYLQSETLIDNKKQ